MKKFLLILLISVFVLNVTGQNLDQNYIAYIERFHTIAIKQQKIHRIPASIILAQGLLESSAGRSRLTIEANNHFGIKCHNWDGDKIYHDDDEKNECFRKYRHAEESYEDHSLFLTSRPRYQSLFQLKTTDYAGWAYGLKAAGYATDPGYAQKLISIIERYNLHQYDTHKGIFCSKEEHQNNKQDQPPPLNVREVYKLNYIKMIVATDADSYASIATEFNIPEKKLRKYNDVGEDAMIKKGNIVYLSMKKKRASRANPVHVVQPGETLYGISQTYGIQLISLYKINNLAFNQGAQIGQIIKLR
ncbi:MAG: glucosaminidase domain-containing protein [Paludibacter sp.]|nr:glucosaminidase domain-containing protein [Paludibacter sp.]